MHFYCALDSFESVDSDTINNMQNIIQYKGTTKVVKVAITKTIDGVTSPFDLTEYTVYLTIKKKKSDPNSAALLIKTVTEHTDSENGLSAIVVIPSDTAQFDYCDYVFDIEISDGNDVRTVSVGHWEIEEKVRD